MRLNTSARSPADSQSLIPSETSQRYFQSNPNTYDVIHDNQCLAWGTLGLQRMGLPVVTTIHHPITRDLDIALAAADTFGLRLLIKRWHSFLRMQKQVIRQLAHKVTVSHAARADIESAFGLPANHCT